MGLKIRAVRALVAKHDFSEDLVCIHSIDDDDNPPAICIYDNNKAFQMFGSDGWASVSQNKGEYFNLVRNIDGVSVSIYRVEECE